MLLIVHIILALATMPLMLGAIVNEYLHFVENDELMPRLSGLSFVGMVSTGTVLVIRSHSPLLGACMQGLGYLAAIGVLYLIYKKIATQKLSD